MLVAKPTDAAFGAMLDQRANWRHFPDGVPYYGEAEGTFVTLGGSQTKVAPEDSIVAFKAFFPRLTDRLAQIFMFFLSHELGNGNATKTRYHVNDVLDWLKYARHKTGDHRPELKRDVVDSIAQLNEMWVNVKDRVLVSSAKGKRYKWIVTSSRLLEVDYETHFDSDPNQALLQEGNIATNRAAGGTPYSFSIALGSALREYAELGTYIRPLASKVKEYNLAQEYLRCAQRIAIALLFGVQSESLTMRDLLARARIEVPKKHPLRFRELIEKALDRLVEDQIVAGWVYKNDVDLPERRWVDVWLRWNIVFSQMNSPMLIINNSQHESDSCIMALPLTESA